MSTAECIDVVTQTCKKCFQLPTWHVNSNVYITAISLLFSCSTARHHWRILL